MEYYPSFFPEMALTVLQALHRILAGVLLGSALIALCVYIVLVGSEMLSHSDSKPKRAKLPQSTRRAPVAEETLVLSHAENADFGRAWTSREEAGCDCFPYGVQIPMSVPANLSEPTWN